MGIQNEAREIRHRILDRGSDFLEMWQFNA